MTDAFQSRFHDALTDLLEQRSFAGDDVRATAVTTLADLLLESARMGEARLPEHFDELMGSLLPRVSAGTRAELSRRLAHSDLVPAATVRLLAEDDPEIAGPVLRQSPVLTEDDLIAFAAGASSDKALAVAGRADLTRTVVSVLIDRNDPVVGAALTLSSAPVIDETIAERIAAIPDLPRVAARQLVEMTDLADATLARLFWLVESDTRMRIVHRIVRRRAVSAPSPARGGGDQLGAALFALAAAGERREIASRLAGALGLSRTLATRIVDDPHGEPLAIAARAAEVPAEQITGLLLLTVAQAGRSYDTLRTLVGLVEDLPPDAANSLVGMWRGDVASGGKGATYEPAVVRASSVRSTGAMAPRRLEDVVAEIARRIGSR